MEITLHTGSLGDMNTIHVSWFDENNNRLSTDIEVNVLPQDSPRTIEIKVDGEVVKRSNRGPDEQTYRVPAKLMRKLFSLAHTAWYDLEDFRPAGGF